MHRIYCPQATPEDRVVVIDDVDEFHHLRDVLRLRDGDDLEAVNGRGLLLRCKIASFQKKSAHLDVAAKTEAAPLSRARIILACAIPKRAKFETIIEKCTELGVDEIIPMLTERTEMRPAASGRKDERYYKVIVNASKQCKRLFFPALHPVTRFDDILSRFALPETLTLIPWLEGDRVPLKDVLLKTEHAVGTALVLIGPEGDFTAPEAARAVGRGAVPVTLGETVLKVDTAAMATVSLLRTLL